MTPIPLYVYNSIAQTTPYCHKITSSGTDNKYKSWIDSTRAPSHYLLLCIIDVLPFNKLTKLPPASWEIGYKIDI